MQIVINRASDENYCEVRELTTLDDLAALLRQFRSPLLVTADEGEYDFAIEVQDAEGE